MADRCYPHRARCCRKCQRQEYAERLADTLGLTGDVVYLEVTAPGEDFLGPFDLPTKT